MYCLLFNRAMSMCCIVLMISFVYVPNSINLMVFVIQIHSALCDTATEFLCVIYINFKLQHFAQADTGRESWRKIRKAMSLEHTKPPYSSHRWLLASRHTNLGLIPGESIQDLWWTKCPATDSSPVVRFSHQYHCTNTYLHLHTTTTRNKPFKDWEPSENKKQRSFRCLYSDSPPPPEQTSKVNAKLEVHIQPGRVSGPFQLTCCALHVNITCHWIVSSYGNKSWDCCCMECDAMQSGTDVADEPAASFVTLEQ
jgi:hypothetical protein